MSACQAEDLQDLNAHIHGGVPEHDIEAMNPYWDAFPELRTVLFKPNRPGYVDLAVDPQQVQQAILDSAEFQAFAARSVVWPLTGSRHTGSRPVPGQANRPYTR